jgi:hypothetical protein
MWMMSYSRLFIAGTIICIAACNNAPPQEPAAQSGGQVALAPAATTPAASQGIANAEAELARTEAELATARAELELAKVKAELESTRDKLAKDPTVPPAPESAAAPGAPEPAAAPTPTAAPEPIAPVPSAPAIAEALDESVEGNLDEDPEALDDEQVWEVFRTYLDVDDPYLNMRAGTSPSTELLGQLPDGTPVEYLGDKEEFRQVEVLEGPYAGKVGYVHRCCVKPQGSKDLYFARLAEIDHFNGHGVRLKSARGVVRQDRANFHMIGGPDIDDGHDLTFHDRKAREWMEATLKHSRMDKVTEKTILEGTPLVQVTVWPATVDVEVLHDEMWRRDKKVDLWRQDFRACLSKLNGQGSSLEWGWRSCGGMKEDRPRDRKRRSSQLSTCRKFFKACPAARNDCQRALRLCLSDGYFDPWSTGY